MHWPGHDSCLLAVFVLVVSAGVRAAPKTRRAKKPRGGAGGDEDDEEDAALLAAQGFWTCSTCTYNNTDVTADSCSMCDQPRGKAT